jgi:hypothetical protein
MITLSNFNCITIFISNKSTFWLSSLILKLGDIDGPEPIEQQIRQVFIHPKYKKGQVYFNVAVLKIDRVQYSETINAICLPPTLDPIGNKYTGE